MSASTIQRSRQVLLFAGLLALFICGSGCQTFNMSEGRFAEEQAGVYKDNAAGTSVIVGGTLLDVLAPDSWR